MRTLTFLGVVFFLLSLGSCNKDPLGVQLQMTPLQYSVPAGLNPIQAHGFVLSEVSTEHIRFETETGTRWEDWARVNPSQARLIITEPGLDWRFAFEVTLKAFTDDPNNLKEIFYRDQIPENVGSILTMNGTDFNVKDLLAGEKFGLVLELRQLISSPPQRLPVRVEYSFSGFRE